MDAAFVALLVGLVLLPVPLGGNRAWAWSIALIWFSLLFLYALIVRHRDILASAAAEPVRLVVPAVMLGAWLAWLASYLIPGPCAGSLDTSGLAMIELQRQCRQALDPDAHTQVLLKSLLYAEIGLLCLLLVDTVRRAYVLIVVMIATAAIWSTLGVLAAFGGVGFDSEWLRIGGPLRASGPFVNPNHFAGYLELILGLGIGALIGLLADAPGERNWRQRLRDAVRLLLSGKTLLRLALVVIVVGLVTTQSRSGNVSFMVALLVGSAAALLLLKRRPRLLVWLVVSLVVIDIAIVSSWFGLAGLAERVGVSAGSAQLGHEQGDGYYVGADEERALVARTTLAMWESARWRGHGGGAFRALYPGMRPVQASARFYDHAHNDHVQLLAEFGLGGTALAGMMVGACLLAALTALRQRSQRSVQGLAAGALIALLALLLHSFSDFNLQIPANAALFTVALALAWQSRFGFPGRHHGAGSFHPPSRSERSPTRPTRAGLLLVVALAADAGATTLAARCHEALQHESAGVEEDARFVMPDLVALRARLAAEPGNEQLRQRAALLAQQLALRTLQLEAVGDVATAERVRSGIRSHLSDTVWRLQRSSDQGSIDAALALQVMVRLGLADAAVAGRACRVISSASAIDGAVVRYERALCEQQHDPAEAVTHMQAAAQDGHPVAGEIVAQLCMRASPADPGCAVEWLCRAAARGRGSAGAAAAFMLIQEPVADLLLVERLYRQAATQGQAVAANNLGELHERGLLGQVDYTQAERWYAQAASRGLAEARLNLARLWLRLDFENPVARARATALLRELDSERPAEVRMLRQRYGL